MSIKFLLVEEVHITPAAFWVHTQVSLQLLLAVKHLRQKLKEMLILHNKQGSHTSPELTQCCIISITSLSTYSTNQLSCTAATSCQAEGSSVQQHTNVAAKTLQKHCLYLQTNTAAEMRWMRILNMCKISFRGLKGLICC